MKKILILLLMIAPLSIAAQTQKFGFVNANAIMQLMPEFTKAQNDLNTLQKQYADEYERMRTELEKKGTEFEQVKDSLPANILQRRQSELQEIYTRMQQYEQESYQNLTQAQQQKLAEVSKVLSDAIQKVGREGGYVCVFDIASGIPYISETLCEDVTDKVKAALNLSAPAK
ncbi:MAG: OmpH family outer membrane protein [Bacteroidaceae bacterium]|nr:OmpH family outer membrane protein [Bacteroidaceae bacterium]MBQ3540078.1 OmpH family outer membrane protein [Bacteroidaceae bacterium]